MDRLPMQNIKMRNKKYRVGCWIKVEGVITIPDNRLYHKWEWAEMALMCHGSNKL